MEEVSLVGVVDIMTGEKDPRNLMVVFSILKVVMMEWDISDYVEVSLLSPQLNYHILIPRSYYLTLSIIISLLHSALLQTTHTESQRKT